MTTETKLTTQNGQAPADMIRLAVTSGADLEKLEKLLTLQERWEANEAKKAYNEAMTAFKANAPKISRDKSANYGAGKAAYTYASLANVAEKISIELSKYGLSASWKTSQNGQVSVTCRIAHVKGHYEETTLSAPADTTGSKNAIQAIGSTISYLERYTLLALTGLATFEMDDDGVSATMEYVNNSELNQLLDLIADKEVHVDKFCQYLKIESLEKLPKACFQQAVAALNAKVKGGGKK